MPEEHELDMFLRAATDVDLTDDFEHRGEVANTYRRKVTVLHRYGRVWIEVHDTRNDRKISMRLNQEEARQLALLFTEHLQ